MSYQRQESKMSKLIHKYYKIEPWILSAFYLWTVQILQMLDSLRIQNKEQGYIRIRIYTIGNWKMIFIVTYLFTCIRVESLKKVIFSFGKFRATFAYRENCNLEGTNMNFICCQVINQNNSRVISLWPQVRGRILLLSCVLFLFLIFIHAGHSCIYNL